MADESVEEFTFPATIANPLPCLLESPPLWPAVAKHGEEEDEWSFNLCDSFHEFKRSTITFRENFCYVDDDDDDDGHGDCEEEKMDVLWEDLNEKFSKKKDSSEDSNSPGRDDHVRVCCVRTLKLSKGNTISWKKASILVLIRFLLKKGFAIHDSAPSIKKLEW